MRKIIAVCLLACLIGCKGPKGDRGENGSPNQVKTFSGTVGSGLPVSGGGFDITLPNLGTLSPNEAILVYVSDGSSNQWQLLPAMDTGGSAFAVVSFSPGAGVVFYNTNPVWVYRVLVVMPPSGSSFQRIMG